MIFFKRNMNNTTALNNKVLSNDCFQTCNLTSTCNSIAKPSVTPIYDVSKLVPFQRAVIMKSFRGAFANLYRVHCIYFALKAQKVKFFLKLT